jgi:hypothetical protein
VEFYEPPLRRPPGVGLLSAAEGVCKLGPFQKSAGFALSCGICGETGRGVMLYFLDPLKPTRKDAYREHRRLSKLDSEAWMNLSDGFPFAERLAPEAVRRSQLFEERLQTAVLRYLNINRYWIEGLLHMRLVARKLNPLLGSKVSGILAEAEPLSFTTVPALLPFHEGLRKYGIEAAVSSIKGNKPPFGMSRGFLALPQVRATAVEAFDAEFSTQGATPLFHPFFSDEPGLFQKWEAAWKCFLITHCERLITDWRALQTRKASRKDVEESLGALEACLEFAGDEPHEFVCCSAAGRIKHRKVGRGLWFAAKRKSAARREGKSRFTGYPVGLWEEPEIQRTFLEGWLSYLRTFMLKCNGVSGYIGLEAEFFWILQQIGLIFDSPEILRRFVSECVGRAALSQLFPSLTNLSPDDEGCPHRRAVLAQFAADPELKSLWLRAGIAHLRHVGVPPFGVPRSFLALDEVLPVAVGLFKSGCCPFSKAAVFHPLFNGRGRTFRGMARRLGAVSHQQQ